MDIYNDLLKPVLFCLDPERAHDLTLATLAKFPYLIPPCYRYDSSHLGIETFKSGINFRNPVGLAAGMDKNGVAILAWQTLGFGFVEIGTVTPKPQEGNKKKRLFRYPADCSLINRMGFNNDGAEAVEKRLYELFSRKRKISIPIGINVGKQFTSDLHEARADHRECIKRLGYCADYIVVNVSSPNTPGLKQLQASEYLLPILLDGKEDCEHFRLPLFLKLSPDLSQRDLDDVIEAMTKTGVNGVIVANTWPATEPEKGGRSGPFLFWKSDWMISHIRKALPLITIIRVGGIQNGDQAVEAIMRGADLVQFYTGLVYRGPELLGESLRSLEKYEWSQRSVIF